MFENKVDELQRCVLPLVYCQVRCYELCCVINCEVSVFSFFLLFL